MAPQVKRVESPSATGTGMLDFVAILVVFMHGAGHALFLANAWGLWKDGPGRSWAFAGVGQTVEGALGLVWLVPLVGFVALSWLLLTHHRRWHTLALASAVASAALVILWWGSLVAGSAVAALLVDAIIVAVALRHQRQSGAAA